MSKWSTFKWSDGTKWADGLGVSGVLYTSFIDHTAFRVSFTITHTVAANATAAPAVLQVAAECEPRRGVSEVHFFSFIDTTVNTQYVSPRLHYTSGATTELTTEVGDPLITEAGDFLVVELSAPFSVDHMRLIGNQRSRSQPVGS